MRRTERESNHLVHLVQIRISGAMPPCACRNGVHGDFNLSTVVDLIAGHDLKLHCYIFLPNPSQFMIHYTSEHSSLCSLTWRHRARACVSVYVYIYIYIYIYHIIYKSAYHLMLVSCCIVTNGVKTLAMHQHTNHRPVKLTPPRFMLQAADGTGSAMSLRLAIPAFWKPSHMSGNFRHETPDAYAAYRT